jgi:hypothetical protein
MLRETGDEKPFSAAMADGPRESTSSVGLGSLLFLPKVSTNVLW